MGAKDKDKAQHATEIHASAGQELPPHQAAGRGRKYLREEDVPEGLHLFGIKRGYRMGGTCGDCLWGHLGLFAWHNQTLNSWTMIAGGRSHAVWMGARNCVCAGAVLQWGPATMATTG